MPSLAAPSAQHSSPKAPAALLAVTQITRVSQQTVGAWQEGAGSLDAWVLLLVLGVPCSPGAPEPQECLRNGCCLLLLLFHFLEIACPADLMAAREAGCRLSTPKACLAPTCPGTGGLVQRSRQGLAPGLSSAPQNLGESLLLILVCLLGSWAMGRASEPHLG